jgi:DNA-binding NarL/FixJ family response regulator
LSQTRVALVGLSNILREVIDRILDEQSGIQVVGSFKTSERFLTIVGELQPDFVLVSSELGGLSVDCPGRKPRIIVVSEDARIITGLEEFSIQSFIDYIVELRKES